MTSTDRLAEMAAEIERLRARIAEYEARHSSDMEYFRGLRERIEAREAEFLNLAALHDRITELEAIVTVGHGTMGTLEPGTGPSDDEPATITHDHPPSAPPHDEPQPHIGHTIKWPARTGDDNE